uniref:Glutathione S-transferase C-terminal domain-containing protein n=1 Tax=Kalanchoe fedtschenkoi TaxID=63787 RepID=A0A7N0VK64_KALFE
MSVWRAFINQGEEQEEALVLALNHLKFVEEHIKGKRFFRGDEIGFTDLIFCWLANLLSILEEISEVKIVLDPQTFPSIIQYKRHRLTRRKVGVEREAASARQRRRPEAGSCTFPRNIVVLHFKIVIDFPAFPLLCI